MMATELLIAGVIFFVLIGSILSARIYRKLSAQGDTAMAKMKLNSEATIKEFKLLLYLHFFEALVLFMFAIGGLTQNHILLDLGRALTLIYGAGLTVVFYRWGRRF